MRRTCESCLYMCDDGQSCMFGTETEHPPTADQDHSCEHHKFHELVQLGIRLAEEHYGVNSPHEK